MEKARKFGAFAGVFTPSLLTILGVIMYMRLGWVVGQAGLITALMIIVLAHVISVSTGLSISSIATDKKIKAGGIYYILSRSLGLPIGGAIGITLFIGTALSISLYLVGFAESFLAIDAIRNFTGLEQNVMGFRIVGTVAIVILVIIAFISTSVAIKTQFYIMGAIGLSLVSIFIGFFVNDEFSSSAITLSYLKDGISPEIVFAIFFPAVTGFTAGVAMSGDLKDPKKNIPRGTLAAIGCGFIIYVALAVGLALFVDRELLLTDYNFLMKVAWFSPLVIAGIWGATLSSALGGILGGPRILQAISSDQITPKIFARGYGASNEPRNALLLIFLIAEAGILIGELDVIAGIVTMFYLASYGFINIAFFLENWASTDFRPSFRVNRYIGLIGFIAAFGVMFKLDMLSMFAAFIIMGLLYFFLKRKQLKSDYGDVWQSVYSSLVRSALHRMSKSTLEQRNWQPNIVLFSGGTEKRPHLIEFGKCLVGRHGVLSNFDLIEKKDAKVLFPKSQENITAEKAETGVFTRRKTVRDLYDGIETISSVYGFSGFEPNTVVMGWARETQQPERFAGMLISLYELDLNVLLLDYDKRTGFGKYKTIDIWWKDISNQGNLALSLCKLLLLSDHWQEARIRLMIVNSLTEHQDHIITEAEELLDSLRINASVKVIDNHIEQQPFYEIVLAESRNTDLVITGIPEIEKGKEAEYIETTNHLLHQIGTVLLIKASSTFKKLNLKVDTQQYKYITETSNVQPLKTMNIPLPVDSLPEKIPDELKEAYASCSQLIQHFHKEYILQAFKFNSNKVLALEKNIFGSFQIIESEQFLNAPREKQSRQLSLLKTNQLILTEKIVQELQKAINTNQRERLNKGLNFLLDGISQVVQDAPVRITSKLYANHLEANKDDTISARVYKRLTRWFRSDRKVAQGVPYAVRFQRLLREYLPEAFYKKLEDALSQLWQVNVSTIEEFHRYLNTWQRYLLLFEQRDITPELLATAKKEISESIVRLKKLTDDAEEILSSRLLEGVTELFTGISKLIDSGPVNLNLRHKDDVYIKRIQKIFALFPDRWSSNRILLYNGIILSIRLKLFTGRLRKIIERTLAEIRQLTEDRIIRQTAILNTRLGEYLEELQKDPSGEFNLNEHELEWDDRTNYQLSLDRIIDKSFIGIKTLINKLPEQTELIYPGAVKQPVDLLRGEPGSLSVSVYQLVDYHVQSQLFESLQWSRETLPVVIFTAASRIRNSLRLVSIGNINPEAKSSLEMVLREDDVAGMSPGWEGFVTFVSEQRFIVEDEMKSIREALNHLQRELEYKMNQTADELTVAGLLKTPDVYKQYTRKRETHKKMSLLRSSMQSVKQKLNRFSAGIWYKQSDAFLLAKKISRGEGKQRSVVDSLLTLYEGVTPKEEALNRLPFYYRQLFLQKYNFKSEFWVNRQKEIDLMQKAIARYKNGFSGGILIRGERNAGKTFFINYIAVNLYPSHPVYALNSPSAGSADPEVFMNILRESTGVEGTADSIFATLKDGSLIVIDDLELWWEKSERGTAVVELIGELIRKYGHKCLFILTVSHNSFQIINQITGIESCFLSVVDLQPFNALAIRKVLMFRHHTSGMDIRRSDKHNSRLSRTDQAKLFARYFTYTKGNIGAALLAWIANITDVRENTLFIRQPQLPDHTMLQRLPPGLKIYLLQFVLHKRLDLPKLQRVTRDAPEVVEKQIQFMKRTGLINERAGQVFELNRYLYVLMKDIVQ